MSWRRAPFVLLFAIVVVVGVFFLTRQEPRKNGRMGVPVRRDRPWRMLSIFQQNTTPSAKPSRVPVTPIAMPAIRNTRITAARLAPMVRMMAMSADLSFTSM